MDTPACDQSSKTRYFWVSSMWVHLFALRGELRLPSDKGSVRAGLASVPATGLRGALNRA